jgi:pimeloyl-ACP methyl ester carboxylesterase
MSSSDTATVDTQGFAQPSPAQAAQSAVFDLFCTPLLRPGQAWEDEVLATATEVGTVGHAGDDLPVYRWGDGPTVVLTHGWGARAAHLGGLAHALADGGFSAVAYDAPAHTRAAMAGRARRQATMVDFARALQAVGQLIGPVHALVGHSAGGVASAFAASGFVDTLVSTPDVPPSSARAADRPIDVERLVLVSAPDRLASMIAAWSQTSGAGTQVIEPLHREILRRFGVPVEAFSVSAHARLLPARTLLIHDAEDVRVPISEAQRVDTALGGNRLVTTRGLGHNHTLTDRDVAARIITHLRQG